MKAKNLRKILVFSSLGTTLSLLTISSISAAINSSSTYEIAYENTQNIELDNLTTNYNSNRQTKLNNAKAKEGYIFLGWKIKGGEFLLK